MSNLPARGWSLCPALPCGRDAGCGLVERHALKTTKAPDALASGASIFWLRGQDLNLRPSGYEPDELPGCSTPRRGRVPVGDAADGTVVMGECRDDLCGPGGDRLSRVLRHSTMGAETFDGRVRDGIGSCRLAKATRPAKIVVGSDEGCIGFRVGARPPGVGGGRAWINEGDQAERAISTGQLHALLRFHTRPIDVVVFHGSSGRTRFEVGFELRCLQLLSRPHIATLHCGWRHNRSTRGAFVPVLSY